MHLMIPIETAPTILYTSIHATHYRTTGLPVLEYYVDNTGCGKLATFFLQTAQFK
jgi:hypothetical protein